MLQGLAQLPSHPACSDFDCSLLPPFVVINTSDWAGVHGANDHVPQLQVQLDGRAHHRLQHGHGRHVRDGRHTGQGRYGGGPGGGRPVSRARVLGPFSGGVMFCIVFVCDIAKTLHVDTWLVDTWLFGVFRHEKQATVPCYGADKHCSLPTFQRQIS